MSDDVPDSPYLGTPWCPGCHPEWDPTVDILETRHCGEHTPQYEMPEPGIERTYLSGAAEAGGDANRALCGLIHRPARCPECRSELTPDDNRAVCEVCGWASAG